MQKTTSKITPSKNFGKPTKFMAGPIIGTYQDVPIYDYIIDNEGVRRDYVGIKTRFESMSDLTPGSVIFMPGLIYSPSI